jgi:pilus assembly protein CpaC
MRCLGLAALVSIPSLDAAPAPADVTVLQESSTGAPRRLVVTVGKSVIVDSPVNIQRVSVANGDLSEALAVNPREVLINGRAPGETTLILWQQGGNRIVYDLSVQPSNTRLDAVRGQISDELAGQEISISQQGEDVFVRGSVKDLVSAERAVAIAGTLGKVVNLLHVAVPPIEQQILLKVRFANVDRAATSELGVNLFSTGALNTPGSTTTGQFSPPVVAVEPNRTSFSLGDALNVFLFRPDLNLGATIKALQSRRLLEMLAEPNVLAINGKPASFVSGGEFPFPTLQGGGAGLGAVTIQFREFGVRINFLPHVTPRGTIRLQVTPEVSSLDFANGLVFQGFNIPALSTRRVQTEIELENEQSFVIAGLLDNRLTETLNKIPGLGDIPLLGKLFQSRSLARNNSELLVLVTPELVRPIPAGAPRPEIEMPREFMKDTRPDPPRTPPISVTGPVPVKPEPQTIPVEQLIQIQKGQHPPAPAMPAVQFVPVPVTPPPSQPANPGLPPAAQGTPQGGGMGAK